MNTLFLHHEYRTNFNADKRMLKAPHVRFINLTMETTMQNNQNQAKNANSNQRDQQSKTAQGNKNEDKKSGSSSNSRSSSGNR